MKSRTLGPEHVVGTPGGYLYESPLWDYRRSVFAWVDIEAGDVYELDDKTGVTRVHRLGQTVAAVGLRAGGGYVLALGSAIAVVDADFTSLDVIHRFAFPDDVRFNDAAVSPDGAYWAGTLSHDRPGVGELYRIGPDGSVTSMLDGASISNGLDWDEDGTHYWVDSGPGTVDIVRSDSTDNGWTITGREQLFSSEPGVSPDGLKVDAEGGVWVALWGGSSVIRLNSAGEAVEEIHVPAPHTSSLAFGGPDLRDLYITTAREDLNEEALRAAPWSGSVFRCRADVAGRHAHEFLG